LAAFCTFGLLGRYWTTLAFTGVAVVADVGIAMAFYGDVGWALTMPLWKLASTATLLTAFVLTLRAWGRLRRWPAPNMR
jgi:hypothetical protein